jgi:hypothetical protein
MPEALSLSRVVEAAWAEVAAPNLTMTGDADEKWLPPVAEAFVGVDPMDVDLDSEGFLAATPLLDLPPTAAAAYLGTFLRAVLISLHQQQKVGFFEDPLTRAHLLTCVKDPGSGGTWSTPSSPPTNAALFERRSTT